MNRRLIENAITAHNRAVKAAQVFEVATPGTRTKETAWARYQAAEKKFDLAILELEQ